ncbi:MAG: AbiV family abortive infection protein [Candidatus Acidiferrales bacterium]
MLSVNSIVEGAFYAMEQAGLLINDAAALYAQRRWPSSLVVAVFSMEELGKAEMMLKRGVEAAKTGPKSKEDVMAGANRHATKLRAGRGKATVTASVSFWGDIPEPNTQESAELEKQLDAAEKIALHNAPNDAHAARMRALYVDLGEDEIWARPTKTEPSEAYLMVSAASIEYGVRRGKFVQPTDDVLKRAVAELGGRVPKLPEAPRVEWPRI